MNSSFIIIFSVLLFGFMQMNNVHKSNFWLICKYRYFLLFIFFLHFHFEHTHHKKNVLKTNKDIRLWVCTYVWMRMILFTLKRIRPRIHRTLFNYQYELTIQQTNTNNKLYNKRICNKGNKKHCRQWFVDLIRVIY